jgi:hypothetical protein
VAGGERQREERERGEDEKMKSEKEEKGGIH